MRMRVPLRAHFLCFQDNRDQNCEHAWEGSADSGPRFFSGLISNHSAFSHTGLFLVPGRSPPAPGALYMLWPLSLTLPSPISIRKHVHSHHSFCIPPGTFLRSPRLAVASCYWSSEHPEHFFHHSYYHFNYILIRLFDYYLLSQLDYKLCEEKDHLLGPSFLSHTKPSVWHVTGAQYLLLDQL